MKINKLNIPAAFIDADFLDIPCPHCFGPIYLDPRYDVIGEDYEKPQFISLTKNVEYRVINERIKLVRNSWAGVCKKCGTFFYFDGPWGEYHFKNYRRDWVLINQELEIPEYAPDILSSISR